MSVHADGLLRFRAPDGWRGEAHRDSLVFAPVAQWDEAQGDPESLRVAVCFGSLVVPKGTTVRSAVDQRMARHVRQGHPDEFSAQVAGRDGRGFDWTDGVFDIRTYFVEVTPRLVAVIEVAMQGQGAHGYHLDIQDVAADALTRIEWHTGVVESVSYEVWRQDDNGNRFLVSGGHTHDEATAVLTQFEALTHKQTYWIRQL